MDASEKRAEKIDSQHSAPVAKAGRLVPKVERFPAVTAKFTNESFASGEGTFQDGTALSEGLG